MSDTHERNLAVALDREKHANSRLMMSLRAAEAREDALRDELEAAKPVGVPMGEAKNTAMCELLSAKTERVALLEDQVQAMQADLVSAGEQVTRLAKRNLELQEQVRDAERLLVQHRWAKDNTPGGNTDE